MKIPVPRNPKGWLRPADCEPPKDGTNILAVISDHGEHDPFAAVVHFVNNDRHKGWCDGCYCLSRPDTDGYCCGHPLYPEDFVIAWHPIPPMPEGK